MVLHGNGTVVHDLHGRATAFSLCPVYHPYCLLGLISSHSNTDILSEFEHNYEFQMVVQYRYSVK